MATATSPVCTIDATTRVITVPAEYKELGVESDERATRINFRCPKIVGDGIDLSALNLYINYENANKKLNSYLIDDVTVSGSNIEFSWLLSRHVTEASGTVRYIVCAKKSDDKEVVNEWNTKVATGTVNAGLEATAEIEEQNIDIIEQILKCIVELENNSGGSSGGSSDITLGLTSATVGQIAKIATVDTGGKPTKWEATDIAAGKDGTDGKDGITPTIGDNGNWYLGETDTGKPSRGAPGKDGVTPNIQIGTVTTLPAGSGATASMGGTTENPLLNLGIPKGADGQGSVSGGLQWHLVADMELEEQTSSISITEDSDGDSFETYSPIAMLCTIGVPADSTQTSTNGNVWITPKPSTDALSRAILSVAGWKTTARNLTELFIGNDSSFLGTGFVAAANGDVFGAPAGYLSGINIYINGSGDHLPVGTKLRVMLLSGGKQ